MSAPQRIVIWCPVCNSGRYRSTRAYTDGDRPMASDFVPLVETQEPPMDGKPILCSDCNSLCKPVLEGIAAKLSQAAEPATVVDDPRGNVVELDSRRPSPRAVVGPNVLELFKADGEEQILNIQQREDKLLVITNRRIVLV